MTYADIVGLFDGVPVIVRCAQETGYKPTPDQLDAAITPRTKWLLLNSPNNPSGATISRPEMKALTDVLMRHSHVYVLADDMYEHIVFDDLEFVTPAQVEPGLYSRTLTLNGVSKAYAMTGWRIGYAAGPEAIIAGMRKVQSQSTSNPTSISQVAAEEALKGDQSCIDTMLVEFKKRHDYVVDELNKLPGIECIKSDGTFYVFPNVEQLISRLEGINNDLDLAEYFIEKADVALVPGSAFGCQGHIRISIATSMENLQTALIRIKKAIS